MSATTTEEFMAALGRSYQYPANTFKKGSQNWQIYERLKNGPVTNSEIIRELNIFNSTGRASEIRRFLREHGLDLIARPLGNGLWQYRLPQREEGI